MVKSTQQQKRPMKIITHESYAHRQLHAKVLLQPIKDQAIKLILQAASPSGFDANDESKKDYVSDRGGAYFVNAKDGDYFVDAKGMVSWKSDDGKAFSRPIQEMPIGNLLTWLPMAAEAIAKRQLALGLSTDPTGLGI